MRLKILTLAGAALSVSLAMSPVVAKVPPEEAEKLGNELTPIGAKKAGNGDEIPAWDGGLQKIPDGYSKDGHYINPFPEDEPLFVIDESNVDEYKDRLSPGQVKMINQYDDYKMPVYKTRRTADYPEHVEEIARRNAVKTELVNNGNGLENLKLAFPFPIVKQPVEIVWNHITRFRGNSVFRKIHQVTPSENGDYTPIQFEEDIVRRHALTSYEPGGDENILFYFQQRITAPSRLAGNVLMLHETINQVKEPRRAWVYNSGQRRVRRAPQVSYDGPGTASDGLRTTDNFDIFNGAPDRYNWELIGKKEMYIPYNAYKLNDPSLSYDDIIKAGHVNQDYARYELHRVWHVRATLKDDERHIYARRDFYVDEDTWIISVADLYDGRGTLWRVQEFHNMFFYDVKVPWYAFEVIYDTLSERYLALGLTNEIEGDPYTFDIKRSHKDYTPSTLRRAGRR